MRIRILQGDAKKSPKHNLDFECAHDNSNATLHVTVCHSETEQLIHKYLTHFSLRTVGPPSKFHSEIVLYPLSEP